MKMLSVSMMLISSLLLADDNTITIRRAPDCDQVLSLCDVALKERDAQIVQLQQQVKQEKPLLPEWALFGLGFLTAGFGVYLLRSAK